MDEHDNLDRNRTPRQLAFDLGRPPSYDADDFLASASNAAALAAVDRWPDWSQHTLLLVGPSGCGKSHLGAIWATRAEARIVRPGDTLDPGRWTGATATLLEDCDRAGHDEAAFFHTLNRTREDGGWLLLTARKPPALWRLTIRDLVSRLRLAPSVEIGRPDVPLIQAVIVKLFADRQIRIEADVVAYAARHCDQSLEAASRFVQAVDEESLAAGRRITRPLAAAAIATIGGDLGSANATSPNSKIGGDDQGPT